MCKPASMIVMPKHRVFWSKTTDSHHEIITEYKLRETDASGFIGLVPVEIVPPCRDLSLPLEQWVYSVDFANIQRELPNWYDATKAEKAVRKALTKWAEAKLTGWRVHEAFHPVHPFTLEPGALADADLRRLLTDWASVQASFGASAWASVQASVRASVRTSVGVSVWTNVGACVWDSVWDSVRASVRDSVWAYIGSLFPDITAWKYTNRTDPWASLRELWMNGYVASFDDTTWRMHSGPSAAVVFEIAACDLQTKGDQ